MLNRKIAPNFKEVSDLNLIKAEKELLDNGVELFVINAGSQELVKIEFLFPGSILQQNIAFLANATNSLIGEGTRNYSSEEIAEHVDFYGAFLQKSAGVDNASVVLYTLNKHLSNILPIVKEYIFESNFPEKELELYIQNTKQDFVISKAKVATEARKQFKKALFGEKHSYGYYSKVEDFDNLNLDSIKSFYNTFYGLENLQIIVSGKVTEQEKQEININFGQIAIQPSLIESVEQTIETSDKKIHFIEQEDAIQSAIRIGRPMFTRKHSDFVEFQVLNCILGGYFGSRLMANIREDKGYTYGIGSGLAAYKNFGYFFISTEVKAEVREAAVSEIYKEINRLQTEEVSNEELQLVKNYLMGSLLRSADGPFAQSDRFKTLLINDLDYSYYTNYVNVVKGISAKRIMELANTYLNKKDLFEIVVGK